MPAGVSSLEPRRVRVLSSIVSASAYAAWVAYGTRAAGAGAMLAGALAQWLFSFAATFGFSIVIAGLVGGSASPLRASAAGAAAAALYVALLGAVHAAIGTPHWFNVLWPVMALASAYAFGFAWNQARHNARLPAGGVRA